MCKKTPITEHAMRVVVVVHFQFIAFYMLYRQLPKFSPYGSRFHFLKPTHQHTPSTANITASFSHKNEW
jgi:hypothetical protein